MTVETQVFQSVAGVNSQQTVLKPSEESFRKQIEEVNNEVAEIREELDNVQEKMNSLSTVDQGAHNEQRQEIRVRMSAVTDKLTLFENSRRTQQERIADHQRAILAHSRNLQAARMRLTYHSVDAVKEHAMELQKKLNNCQSLQEEKKLINEISTLKQQIPSIKAAIRQVEELERDRPDLASEISACEAEMERIRLDNNEARNQRRDIEKELSAIDQEDGDNRKQRKDHIQVLLKRREELNDLLDKKTSTLMENQAQFNLAMSNFRDYENRKRKTQQEKLRERKRAERFDLERQQILTQLKACVVEDDDEDEANPERLQQLWSFCENEIKRLEAEEGARSESKKNKKGTIALSTIQEFDLYGLGVPQTIQEFQDALDTLSPHIESQQQVNQKLEDAIAVRRIALEKKLAILDEEIAKEAAARSPTSSPKTVDNDP